MKYIETICNFCKKDLKKRATDFHKSKNHFCDEKCSGAFKRVGIEQPCFNCGILIYVTPGRFGSKTRKTDKVFCSKSCSISNRNTLFKNSDHALWNGGFCSYRERALRDHGTFCQNPWCDLKDLNFEIPVLLLDVDHIDNNRDNNEIDNLQVLCVWCHARKTRNVF